MIFVTVGTHQQPFTRLVEGLTLLNGADLVVQYGHAEPPAGVARASAFMSFGEMQELFQEADAVVTHAGVGSILCATNSGHVPIVVPRLRRHGEHVDDHQVALVDELGRTGRVVVVRDVAQLPAALEALPARRANAQSPSGGPLQRAVRAALEGERRAS